MRHDNVSESAVKGLENGEESGATNKLLKLQTVQREQSAITFYSCLRVMAYKYSDSASDLEVARVLLCARGYDLSTVFAGSALVYIGPVSSMQHK